MTTEQTTTPTRDEQIAAAEQSGRWFDAMALKVGRVKQQHNPAHAPDDDVRQQIAEAEATGDYMTAMSLKVASIAPAEEAQPVDISGPEAQASEQAAAAAETTDPTIDDKIAEAEAAGDWTTSMRLKLKRAGG